MSPLSATAIRRADPDWAARRAPGPHLTRNSDLAPPHCEHRTGDRVRPRPVAADDAAVAALHALVLATLDDDQAVEVVSIPLAGKTSIADHMVIASGRSTRQVASASRPRSPSAPRLELGRSVRIEGLPAADWVLIDAQDVIVHLFRPEVRSFYNLEKMWAFDGPSGSTGPAPRAAEACRAGCGRTAVVEHDPIEAEPVDPVAEGIDPALLAERRSDERLVVKLHIVAHGRIGRGPEAALVDRYLPAHRVAGDADRAVRHRGGKVPDPPTPAVTVLLDERGEGADQPRRSPTRSPRWRDDGMREARFVIGPADGHGDRGPRARRRCCSASARRRGRICWSARCSPSSFTVRHRSSPATRITGMARRARRCYIDVPDRRNRRCCRPACASP